MMNRLDITEETKCGNCKHKTTYIAGKTYEACGKHANFSGLHECPFIIPDGDWFCADFEEFE